MVKVTTKHSNKTPFFPIPTLTSKGKQDLLFYGHQTPVISWEAEEVLVLTPRPTFTEGHLHFIVSRANRNSSWALTGAGSVEGSRSDFSDS